MAILVQIAAKKVALYSALCDWMTDHGRPRMASVAHRTAQEARKELDVAIGKHGAVAVPTVSYDFGHTTNSALFHVQCQQALWLMGTSKLQDSVVTYLHQHIQLIEVFLTHTSPDLDLPIDMTQNFHKCYEEQYLNELSVTK